MRKLTALAAATTLAALAATPAMAAQGDFENGRLSTCFWHYGAFGVDDYNIAYPDAGATYWGAFVRRPVGSTLRLRGTFQHARYMSIISYDSAGQFVDGLADYQLNPDPGSTNPFRPGADRTGSDATRQYTVRVLDARPTVDGTPTGAPLFNLTPKNNEAPRNDLYARPRTPLAEVLAANDPAVLRGEYPTGPVQLELLLLRIYVNDAGTDLNGNVPMPEPELTLSNGTVLTGQAACDRMDSEGNDYKATHAGAGRLPEPTSLLINEQGYAALRYQDDPSALPAPCNIFGQVGCPPISPPFPPVAPQHNNTNPGATPLVVLPRTPFSLPATFPARYPVQWRAQYNRRYFLQTYDLDSNPGAETNPVRGFGGGGFFPNNHNTYIRTAVSRKFGKVMVIRGKLPTSPTTFQGDETMGDWANGGFQNRYTAYCMNESIRTTRVMDCVYDEEIPTEPDTRFFTIAASRADDRPSNADPACGIAWVEWGIHGDGASFAGDLRTDDDGGYLNIRHMLPDPSFAEAIQNTRTPGDEKTVMGDYLPTVTYMSPEEFAADGCAFDGLLQPINRDGSSVFKLGSTVPVKFHVDDIAGNPVDTASATLSLAKVSNQIEGSVIEAASTSAATSGNAFRSVGGGDYVFNLSTNGLSTGTWSLIVKFANGREHRTEISLR